MKSKFSYPVILIILTVLFVGFGCFIYFFPGETVPVGEVLEPDIDENEGNSGIDEVLPFICPFDGTPLEELPLRPVVVTIDNFAPARPQSGLSAADLIYEIPAEGGITRFLAVYYHGKAEKIGPIRSARPYLALLAQDWNGVYIHAGESPQAQIFFKQEGLDHINEMFHPQGFWRDKNRKAPHNLYSSSESLWKEIVKKGWDKETHIDQFTFLSEGEELQGGTEASQVTIKYPYSNIFFKKDSASDLYHRFLGDKPQIDKETGAQLTASNIIVQEVQMRVFDSEGRLEIDLIGEGKAWLFSGGRVVEGRWVKDEGKRTRYIDLKGNKFFLKPGQTWIEIVSKSDKIEY